MCEYIEYLVTNSYVVHEEQVYWQKRGIPMGTNAGVYLANYFLFTLELAYVRIPSEKSVKI